MTAETIAAMSLLPGDVAHISPHLCHGLPVDCGERDVEVTAVRWGDEGHGDIVIDYGPAWSFPGEPWGRCGSVVYERLERVLVHWHGMGATA